MKYVAFLLSMVWAVIAFLLGLVFGGIGGLFTWVGFSGMTVILAIIAGIFWFSVLPVSILIFNISGKSNKINNKPGFMVGMILLVAEVLLLTQLMT